VESSEMLGQMISSSESIGTGEFRAIRTWVECFRVECLDMTVEIVEPDKRHTAVAHVWTMASLSSMVVESNFGGKLQRTFVATEVRIACHTVMVCCSVSTLQICCKRSD